MRLVFAGTPDPAVASLRALHEAGHDIAAVLTRTDAPLGRKRVLTPSPTAQAADALGLPTIKANRLDDAVTAEVAALEPDLGVIVAYGGLVREPLLSTPRLGWINLHFSLLPRWRGASPVQHALIAGDAETGASVFQLVPALDAGDVFDEVRYPVPAGATAGDVLGALTDIGATLLMDVVAALAAGTATATPQSGEPTLAPKLTLADGRIRWTDSASQILHRLRGTTPEPGAHTMLDGGRFKILDAVLGTDGATVGLDAGMVRADGSSVLVGTGTDAIRLLRVQPAGKAGMDAADWWRGLRTDHLQFEDEQPEHYHRTDQEPA